MCSLHFQKWNEKKEVISNEIKVGGFSSIFFFAITSHESHGTRLISWTWKKKLFPSWTSHSLRSSNSVTTTHTINLFFAAERRKPMRWGCALLAYRYQHRYKFTATMSILFLSSLQLRNDFIMDNAAMGCLSIQYEMFLMIKIFTLRYF